MSNDYGTRKLWTIGGGKKWRVADSELKQLNHGEPFLRLHSHQMGSMYVRDFSTLRYSSLLRYVSIFVYDKLTIEQES